MTARSVLVVAVDGLRASALGAYGNTSVPTPALDAFAADSFLLDWCYAPTAELIGNYRALWQSVHPARPYEAGRGAVSLPRLVAQKGYTTTLVSDAPELSSFEASSQFDRCVEVPTASGGFDTIRVEEVMQTALARVLAVAAETVAMTDESSPNFVWVHARGMYGPWDAPLELQRSLLDEDDPPPTESAEPPDIDLSDSDEPDAAFRYSCAYAAQTIVLDACWPGLLDAVGSTSSGQQWLVALIGVRGYPLGEHRRIGGVDPRLYGEQLHVPWLMRSPDGTGRLARSGGLASPLDLLPTLAEWTGGDVSSGPAEFDGMSIMPSVNGVSNSWRGALLSSSGAGPRSLRTVEWSLRQEAAAAQFELFVRPDDRWEANDVAKLCPDVTEQLSREADEIAEKLRPC